MKITSKTTIALLMAATLCMSGCGGSKTGESSNTNNNQTTTAASKASEEAVKAEANNEFDIDAYIANYTPKTELTNKSVFDYEVKVNGAVLTCPISTAELAALGYETAMPYSIELTPNEISEVKYDSRYYVHKDTGVALLLTDISTTSSVPIAFDSSKPRDDVLFYNLTINYNERNNRNTSLEAEFYGGTICKTTENELMDKCGTFDKKKNLSRTYYEYPDAEKPTLNNAHFIIDENVLLSIGFDRTPDKVQK